MDSIVSKTFLFSFQGRINRAKYWYALLASTIFCLVLLSILSSAVGGFFGVGVESVGLDFEDVLRHFPSLPFHVSFGNAGPTSAAALSFYVLGTPICIVGVWFLAATTVKRLHDRNKSGWWIVPFYIAPPLLGRLWDWLDNPDLLLLVEALRYGLDVWCIVELLWLSGAKAPNRFGPDPLAPVETGTPDKRPGWDQYSELEFVPHSAGPSAGPHVNRGT
jgi:uncharacterized membrane protein YhaH (DUF805 family)